MARVSLCLTPGDPLGIGPEIAVKWLLHDFERHPDWVVFMIGNLEALQREARSLGITLPLSERIHYVNVEGCLPGEIAYQSLVVAVEHMARGEAEACVTGPISKQHLQAAGHLASGHTEIFAALAKHHFPEKPVHPEMLFVYQNFRLMLLTRHVPLREVSSVLMSQNNRQSFQTLIDFLHQMGHTKPRIAVLGLNPHAGEIGGSEETLILAPLIAAFNETTAVQLEGPFAADGFFRTADRNAYDAVVAMYHDQGLIPFKLMAGYKAVNVTIGLPFIRTSVSHGTAFDIAGKGMASHESLSVAVETACELVHLRHRVLV